MKDYKKYYSQSSPFPKEGRRNILLLGNGFDIDLGLKSRYSDFINSNYFQTVRDTCQSNLMDYIEECVNNSSTWFDLEKSLKDYALKESSRWQKDLGGGEMAVKPELISHDKETFEAICQNLSSYLNSAENQVTPDRNSKAWKVLDAIIKNGWYSIYSFNYTDLYKIGDRTGLSLSNTLIHNIHGSCQNNSIILGFDERAEIHSQYNFLLKSFNQYYNSLNLISEMDEANDIVFFGLSFGNIDYVYFESFFKNIIASSTPKEEKKTITIFTWNETSRIAILDQLRRMNINIMELFNKCYLHFIRTDFENYPDDRNLLESFLCWQYDSSSMQMKRIRQENLNKIAQVFGR